MGESMTLFTVEVDPDKFTLTQAERYLASLAGVKAFWRQDA